MARYGVKLLLRSEDPKLAEWTWEKVVNTIADSEHEARRMALEETYDEGDSVIKVLGVRIRKPKHKEE